MASIQQAFNQILGSVATASAVGKHLKGQKEQTSAVKEQTEAIRTQTAENLLKDPEFTGKVDKAITEMFGNSMSEDERKRHIEMVADFEGIAKEDPEISELFKGLSSEYEKLSKQQQAETSAVSSLAQKVEQKQNANVGFKERQSILLDKTGRNLTVLEKYVEENK